jgi:hypothetical protein
LARVQPQIGKPVAEIDDISIRELVVPLYRVFYWTKPSKSWRSFMNVATFRTRCSHRSSRRIEGRAPQRVESAQLDRIRRV